MTMNVPSKQILSLAIAHDAKYDTKQVHITLNMEKIDMWLTPKLQMF